MPDKDFLLRINGPARERKRGPLYTPELLGYVQGILDHELDRLNEDVEAKYDYYRGLMETNIVPQPKITRRAHGRKKPPTDA
jgi:hypothetical protein